MTEEQKLALAGKGNPWLKDGVAEKTLAAMSEHGLSVLQDFENERIRYKGVPIVFDDQQLDGWVTLIEQEVAEND